jgi:prepilin-type N-terminal cleavage/methylation domain-containing protein
MLRNTQGFSLVELIVVMAVFVVVIGVAGDAFNRMMQHASIQTRSAENNIEGIIGLETLRKDLVSAGFGVPWSFQDDTITYSEVDDSVSAQAAFASDYNDTSTNRIRAIVSGNFDNSDTSTTPDVHLKGTDYLVIRATSIATRKAAQRWSYMNYTGMVKPDPVKPVSWSRENLENSDRVIVIRMGLTGQFTKELVMDDTRFFTTYGNLSKFEPQEAKVSHFIYGVYYEDEDKHDLRMPFNRADYYVRIPAAGEYNKLPARCAHNTGILYKATVNHSNGDLTELPLLDCVADMQIVYVLDSASNGVVTYTDDVSALNSEEIREQLKSIKVFILTHEGAKDQGFTYPNSTIRVGPAGTGRIFDLAANIVTDWQRYRWKIYQLTVNPTNLTNSTQ